MKSKNLIESFSFAIQGFMQAFHRERNVKIHCTIAILILFLGIFLQVPRVELLLLFITITLVIVAEFLNTAIEAVLDLLHPEFHPKARLAKNVAAGAVLVSALNALVVGFVVFYQRLDYLTMDVLHRFRGQPAYLSFLSLVVVFVVIVGLKMFQGRKEGGFHLQGGMPSIHSAMAFGLAGMVLFFTDELLLIAIAFVLALIVAQSRVEGNIHSLEEVIWGGLIGFLLTTGIFQIFLR